MKQSKAVGKVDRPEPIPPKDICAVASYHDEEDDNLDEHLSGAKDEARNVPAEGAEGSLSARDLCGL